MEGAGLAHNHRAMGEGLLGIHHRQRAHARHGVVGFWGKEGAHHAHGEVLAAGTRPGQKQVGRPLEQPTGQGEVDELRCPRIARIPLRNDVLGDALKNIGCVEHRAAFDAERGGVRWNHGRRGG